jgi:phosphatidylglycerophosphate synthase
MQKFRTSACLVVTAMSARIPNVAVVIAIGAVLLISGFALLLNLFGAGDYVIRRVTSRYLGTLPPGFAASKRGFRIYAVLVLSVGVLCLGLAAAAWLLPLGAALLVLGAVGFGVASMMAIAGEVETARGQKGG